MSSQMPKTAPRIGPALTAGSAEDARHIALSTKQLQIQAIIAQQRANGFDNPEFAGGRNVRNMGFADLQAAFNRVCGHVEASL